MNNLTTKNNITMSSREIADLVESRHDDVKRSIERLSDRGVIQLPPLAEVKNHLNQTVQVYLVGKRDSYVVVAQLSPEFTARLVDRWQELEDKSSAPAALPGDYLSALKALTAEVEQRQQLESQLALAAPKVEFADLVGEADGILIGNYAKLVKLGQNKLFAWLRDHGVLISGGSRRNVPMQEYMGRGYFTVKEIAVNTNHGVHISFTTKITGKGQQWLTRKLIESGVLKAVGDAA